MPVVRKLVARLLGRFPEVSIPPDEAIALGAATQAALVAKSQSLEEVLLTDVCPYTLGIGTNPSGEFSPNVEYVFAPIIERNTILPASREEYFTTMIDMQRKVQCIVYQGEHRFVKDNIKLGSLDVKFPAKKAGEIAIAVRFTYDVSGMLEIDATVVQTNEKFSLTLLGNAASLSEEEIASRRQQLKNLKIHPREDTANKALIERADRLYIELSGKDREHLAKVLDSFVRIIETQDVNLIESKRREFAEWLDHAEKLLI